MKQALLEDAQHDERALDELNAWLGGLQAEQRVIWALAHAPGTHVLSSSFGAQAAVSLHLLTRQRPDLRRGLRRVHTLARRFGQGSH